MRTETESRKLRSLGRPFDMTEEKHAEADMRKKWRTLVTHNLNKDDFIDYVYTTPRSFTDEFAYHMFRQSAAATTPILHKCPHDR